VVEDRIHFGSIGIRISRGENDSPVSTASVRIDRIELIVGNDSQASLGLNKR
jgi:hypothetical protein